MKIAIVTTGGADPSGQDRVIPCLLWLIERLAQGGDDVHVFSLCHEGPARRWRTLGVTVHNACGGRHLGRLFAQIFAEHRRAPFDVFHTMWSLRANLVAVMFAKLFGVPSLVYFGSDELASLPDIEVGRRRRWKGRLAVRAVTLLASRVAAQSDYMVGVAKDLGIQAYRLSLGVALDRWAAKAPRRRAAGAPLRLLHVSNITPVKDYDMLLDTAAALVGLGVAIELDVIGLDVAGDAKVQKRAAELGLGDRFRFHGFLRHADMRPFFDRADLFVLTSRYDAGPMVVLEAAVAGIPTAGTAVGHLMEWAPEAARTVMPRDAAGLAQVIAAIAGDEDLRLSLAQRAQERALAENADVTSARFRAMYGEMVHAPRTVHAPEQAR